MRVIVIIFIIALIVYAIYYLATQVQFKNIFSFPFVFTPQATTTPPSSYVPPPPQAQGVPTAPVVTPPPLTPPRGFTLADLSPHYGKVNISWIIAPDFYFRGGEITLRAEYSLTAPLDVTGWRIKPNRGEMVLTGAPSGPVGPVNQPRLVLRPNATLTVYGWENPFVRNVELNACTGYLNETYAMTPLLPQNCPYADRGEITTFSGECQSFIFTLSSCETPTPNELNRFTGERDRACRAYLDTLNYSSCYRRHAADANFLSYGLRVWYGDGFPLDRAHDRLILLDGAGKVVDEYVY